MIIWIKFFMISYTETKKLNLCEKTEKKTDIYFQVSNVHQHLAHYHSVVSFETNNS